MKLMMILVAGLIAALVAGCPDSPPSRSTLAVRVEEPERAEIEVEKDDDDKEELKKVQLELMRDMLATAKEERSGTDDFLETAEKMARAKEVFDVITERKEREKEREENFDLKIQNVELKGELNTERAVNAVRQEFNDYKVEQAEKRADKAEEKKPSSSHMRLRIYDDEATFVNQRGVPVWRDPSVRSNSTGTYPTPFTGAWVHTSTVHDGRRFIRRY